MNEVTDYEYKEVNVGAVHDMVSIALPEEDKLDLMVNHYARVGFNISTEEVKKAIKEGTIFYEEEDGVLHIVRVVK